MKTILQTDAQTLEHLSDRFVEAAFDIQHKEHFLETLCSLSNQIAGWATETEDLALSKILRVEFGVLFEVYKTLKHATAQLSLDHYLSTIMASLERIRQRQAGLQTSDRIIFLQKPRLVS